jgi:hypothetical protein
MVGATPPFGQSVHKSLNEKFPNAWTVRCRTISGASRSPQLSPMGFVFVWIHQEHVYGENIQDLRHLRDSITAAIAGVTPYSVDLARDGRVSISVE